MKKLVILTLTLLSFNLYSQDIATVDSLLNSVNARDTSHVYTVVKALELSKILEYEKGEARAYHKLGFIYNIKGNVRKSAEKFLLAEQLYESIGDNENVAFVNLNLAYLYNQIRNNEKEFECAQKALKLTKLDSLKAYAYSSIGRVHLALGRHREGIKSYETAIAVKEKSGQLNDVYDFINTMACAYEEIKQYDSAIATHWRVRQYAYGRPAVLARMYSNIGVCYHLKGDFEHAELYYLEAIVLDSKKSSGSACLNYAELLHQMGEPQKAKSYLAKGLTYNYDLHHLGQTLHAMKMFEQSSLVRDCLYVHATKDFERLTANSVSVAMIESDLKNAREKAALKEASVANEKLAWAIGLISLLVFGLAGKYIWSYREKIADATKRFDEIRSIIKSKTT